MTETKWLSSTDPVVMLGYLRPDLKRGSGRHAVVSDRKLRLWACACCRAVECGVECPDCGGLGFWLNGSDESNCRTCHGTGRISGLADPRSRQAVEMAERFADGEVAARAIQTGTWFAQRVYEGVRHADVERILRLVRLLGGGLLGPEGQGVVPVPATLLRGETPVVMGAVQAALLRDIVGNPGREPSLCGKEKPYRDPSGKDWYACSACKDILRWNDRTVPRMAAAIYEERAWDRMPILGDALEEARCGNQDILNHCRGMRRCSDCLGTQRLDTGGTDPFGHPIYNACDCNAGYWPDAGPHARGCWVLDLLLGKG